MRNEFLIYIKLLTINPETGKAFEPPCEIQPQIVFNLFYYLENFKRDKTHNSDVYQNAVREILQKIQTAFNCPLGWMIEMQSYDEFFALDNEFYQPKKRYSEEFFYSPLHNSTDINTDFMYEWSLDTVSARYEN